MLLNTIVLLAGTASALVVRATNPRCKEVAFRVSSTAQNFNILNPNDIAGTIADALGLNNIVAAGTQKLAGYYCEPITNNGNSTKLQLFRGSFFTNRDSWTALGGTPLQNGAEPAFQPERYSWFDYANKLGYPTLAVDTLGDGNSARPDPVLVAQLPYDVELYHTLIQQIRNGKTGQLPRACTYIAHIGNSFGSVVGNSLAAKYPDDINAYILTGWSKRVQPSLPGISLNNPAPATLTSPFRFPFYPLGYVTSTSETALTNSFFGDASVVDFDPQVAKLFFDRRDVASLGDVITTYLPTSAPVASKYKGRVLVLTGENDQAFCRLGSSALSPNAKCGSLLKDSGSLFPAAEYSYQSVPKTGHATILHRSSQSVFGIAHSFLAGKKFGQ